MYTVPDVLREVADETLQAWYTQNLQISIPVTIAAAFVIFLLLYFIISGEVIYLAR